MTTEIEGICQDAEGDAASRTLANRCLTLCLRAEAANDVADGPLLNIDVDQLLAFMLRLRASDLRADPPGGASLSHHDNPHRSGRKRLDGT